MAEIVKNNLPEMLVTAEEWSTWLEHPTTKTFRKFLRKQIGDTRENWSSGAFTSPDQAATVQLNARAIGTCAAYQSVLQLTSEDINEGLSDE